MSVEQTGGLCCKWVIENFTYCLDEINLSSRNFSPNNEVETNFSLNLYLNRNFMKNGFFCYLKRADDGDLDSLQVNYEISILAADGSFKQIYLGDGLYLPDSNGHPDNSRVSMVSGRDIMGLLNKNTLTICCRILNYIKPIYWFLRTRIGVQKRTFKWSVNIYEDSQRYSLVYSNMDDLLLSLDVDEIGVEIMKIKISQGSPYPFPLGGLQTAPRRVTCVVSILDIQGNVAVSYRDEYLFTKDTDEFELEIWNLSFPVGKNWLLGNRDTCVSENNTFSLWFEIDMSDGRTTNEVEKIHFGKYSDCVDQNISPSTNSLMNGLMRLYQERKFCDVTIQTEHSLFPVHKAVVCAQSSVFTAMFERDVEEKRTGIVPITDVADDTIQQMLMFMYTNTVQDLQWESALKLYLASNKYDVFALKHICKNLLKTKLSVENVVDALLLADLNVDDDLKSVFHDYILEKDSEVIGSEMWKKFLQDHMKLGSETMHQLYLKKIQKMK